MFLRAVCNYNRKHKFLVDVNLRNGGFIIPAADFFFGCKTGNLRKTTGLYVCAGGFLLKGSVESRLFIL